MGTPENLHIVDAISNLPAHVIDNILVRLPLREAVRTSVLSEEWRYKWTYISELVFDDDFSRRRVCDRSNSREDKFERIVYQALLCHRGPINKFSLDAPHPLCSPDVDHWILFLSNFKVREFCIWFNFCNDNKHEMASRLFTFQHLTHLSLGSCVFKPPPQFKGFSKLVTLDFRSVEFDPAIFARFISQCLLLERVELLDCSKWDSIEVEGPSLRLFSFDGDFKSIRIKNVPVLAEVSLALDTVDTSERQSSIESLGFVPTLEILHLGANVLELLGAGGVPYRFPDSFNSLTGLQLSMYFKCIEEVTCALCIIRSCRNLQVLNVWSVSNRKCEAVTEFIRAQKIPDRYLNQLRLVGIKLFSKNEAQMEFVRYLLAAAGELEEMVITLGITLPCEDLSNLLEHSPRASPSVVVNLVLSE